MGGTGFHPPALRNPLLSLLWALKRKQLAEEKFQACKCPIVITWSACCITYSCLGRKHALNILNIPALCIYFSFLFSLFYKVNPRTGILLNLPVSPFSFFANPDPELFLPGLTRNNLSESDPEQCS